MKLLLPFVAITLAACVPEFSEPLTASKKGKKDKCFIGEWYGSGEDNEGFSMKITHLKGKGQYQVQVIDQEDGEEDTFSLHLSKSSGHRYINVEGEDGWYILDYNADKLTMRYSLTDMDAMIAAVNEGDLNGEISSGLFTNDVSISDPAKIVQKWLNKNHTTVFKDYMSVKRVGDVPRGCK